MAFGTFRAKYRQYRNLLQRYAQNTYFCVTLYVALNITPVPILNRCLDSRSIYFRAKFKSIIENRGMRRIHRFFKSRVNVRSEIYPARRQRELRESNSIGPSIIVEDVGYSWYRVARVGLMELERRNLDCR